MYVCMYVCLNHRKITKVHEKCIILQKCARERPNHAHTHIHIYIHTPDGQILRSASSPLLTEVVVHTHIHIYKNTQPPVRQLIIANRTCHVHTHTHTNILIYIHTPDGQILRSASSPSLTEDEDSSSSMSSSADRTPTIAQPIVCFLDLDMTCFCE
jgi:hypothetical protein